MRTTGLSYDKSKQISCPPLFQFSQLAALKFVLNLNVWNNYSTELPQYIILKLMSSFKKKNTQAKDIWLLDLPPATKVKI